MTKQPVGDNEAISIIMSQKDARERTPDQARVFDMPYNKETEKFLRENDFIIFRDEDIHNAAIVAMRDSIIVELYP